MRVSVPSLVASLVLCSLASAAATPRDVKIRGDDECEVISPKVFIISMFAPEAEVWYGIPEFDLLANNVTVPGFSPLYPDAHCTADGEICQLTTGESGKARPYAVSLKCR